MLLKLKVTQMLNIIHNIPTPTNESELLMIDRVSEFMLISKEYEEMSKLKVDKTKGMIEVPLDIEIPLELDEEQLTDLNSYVDLCLKTNKATPPLVNSFAKIKKLYNSMEYKLSE